MFGLIHLASGTASSLDGGQQAVSLTGTNLDSPLWHRTARAVLLASALRVTLLIQSCVSNREKGIAQALRVVLLIQSCVSHLRSCISRRTELARLVPCASPLGAVDSPLAWNDVRCMARDCISMLRAARRWISKATRRAYALTSTAHAARRAGRVHRYSHERQYGGRACFGVRAGDANRDILLALFAILALRLSRRGACPYAVILSSGGASRSSHNPKGEIQ